MDNRDRQSIDGRTCVLMNRSGAERKLFCEGLHFKSIFRKVFQFEIKKRISINQNLFCNQTTSDLSFKLQFKSNSKESFSHTHLECFLPIIDPKSDKSFSMPRRSLFVKMVLFVRSARARRIINLKSQRLFLDPTIGRHTSSFCGGPSQ